MLTSITIRRFRSIESLTLDIKQGLNVLVGPNGSGKSNIIDACSFVAKVVSDSIESAISQAGGSANCFRRDKGQALARSMRFECEGVLLYPDFQINPENPREYIEPEDALTMRVCTYKYAFSVSRRPNRPPALSRQSLHVYSHGVARVGSDSIPDDAPDDLSLHVTQSAGGKFVVKHADVPLLGLVVFKEQHSKRYFHEFLSDQLNARSWSDESLISRVQDFVYAAHLVSSSLSKLQALAVRPSIAKQPDDISVKSEIRSDGGGLASTIHSLQSKSHPKLSKSQCTKALDEITSELTMAVPSITSLGASSDRETGKVTLEFTIESHAEHSIRLPIGAASDGTVKWITLLTALNTANFFSIEEPENFLHPWMQRELIRLVREHADARGEFSALISTHSESLLDRVKPDELLVVEYRDGKTVASRPKNSAQLVSEINRTGFGLGHFYVAGAVD